MNKKRDNNQRILGKYDGRKRDWLRTGIQFACLLIVIFILFRFVVGFSVVDGVSMQPTLEDGHLVCYTRIVKELNQGDIVSVKMPSGEYFVKRVIATEGDVVELKNGTVYVNGSPLEEPYAIGGTYPQEGTVTYPYTVEPGKVYLLGDNREASVDSRTFGAVLIRQVKGKIRFK